MIQIKLREIDNKNFGKNAIVFTAMIFNIVYSNSIDYKSSLITLLSIVTFLCFQIPTTIIEKIAYLKPDKNKSDLHPKKYRIARLFLAAILFNGIISFLAGYKLTGNITDSWNGCIHGLKWAVIHYIIINLIIISAISIINQFTAYPFRIAGILADILKGTLIVPFMITPVGSIYYFFNQLPNTDSYFIEVVFMLIQTSGWTIALVFIKDKLILKYLVQSDNDLSLFNKLENIYWIFALIMLSMVTITKSSYLPNMHNNWLFLSFIPSYWCVHIGVYQLTVLIINRKSRTK